MLICVYTLFLRKMLHIIPFSWLWTIQLPSASDKFTWNQVFQGFLITVWPFRSQFNWILEVPTRFLASTSIPKLVSNPVKISVSMWMGLPGNFCLKLFPLHTFHYWRFRNWHPLKWLHTDSWIQSFLKQISCKLSQTGIKSRVKREPEFGEF